MPFSKRLESVVIYSVNFVALYFCVPGFLPKEVRNYFIQLFTTDRGHGLLFMFASSIPLLLAAARIKRRGYTRTIVGACFCLLTIAMTFDLLADAILGHVVSNWLLRALWVFLFIFGIAAREDLLSSFKLRLRDIKRSTFLARIVLFLGLFFLLRQSFAFFYNRGGPFADEINFWHTAATDFLSGGFATVIQKHSYTLAVPWLASLPVSLFGGSHSEHVYAYSTAIVFGSIFLVVELARSPRALLAGLGVLLLCFAIQRDLFSLYGASLYGEGLASLLCATVLLEFLRLYYLKRPTPKQIFAFSLIAAFAAVSKPPLAYLVWMLPVVLATRSRSWPSRALLLFSGILFVPWRLWLALLNKSTYYQSFDLLNALDRRVAFEIPIKMISGLLDHGTPQSAYTIALIVAVVLAILKKSTELLRVYALLIFVYWGFVFALYATLWQHMEQFSAGRYISHAAIACVLMIPLAFSKTINEETK
ncbi:MAG TPA: hypothetical protein PLH57_02665 [Oligoflexia bacterium]|nr:hypothetical protein [Oligoflexia bacterium]